MARSTRCRPRLRPSSSTRNGTPIWTSSRIRRGTRGWSSTGRRRPPEQALPRRGDQLMSVTKLSLPTADAEAAQALAALLTDAVPAGAAVALFRDAAADGWRVEAYCETGDLPAVVGAISQAAPQEAARLSVEALPNANWVAISQA